MKEKFFGYDRDKNLTGLKTLVRQGALNGKYGLLTDNHYSYDKAGNCVIKQTLSGETRYSYDSLYRLTEAVYPNKREQLTYDRAGNRLTRTAGNGREVYTYDNANRLTKRSIYNITVNAQDIPETPDMADRMYRYTYDRQGNMLSDGDNTYQYDSMNRLKEINTKAGDIQKNHYDGEGLRAELEENGLNLYTYCQNNPVEYVDPSGHKVCKRKYNRYKKLRKLGLTAEEAHR